MSITDYSHDRGKLFYSGGSLLQCAHAQYYTMKIGLLRGETRPKGAGKRRAVAQKDYTVHSTTTYCQKDCAGNAPCIADEAQVPQVSGQYSAEYLKLCHTVC